MRHRRMSTFIAVAAAASAVAAAPAAAHERGPDAEIFATNNTRVITDPADPALQDRLRGFRAEVKRIIREAAPTRAAPGCSTVSSSRRSSGRLRSSARAASTSSGSGSGRSTRSRSASASGSVRSPC